MAIKKKAGGFSIVKSDLKITKSCCNDKIIALAGNPNVGKSTVFNALTGLRQHTGNWPGKTVVNAQGRYEYKDCGFVLVDVPGTYSLMAQSADEEAARDFICFGKPDATIIVTDATCLERNLILVLQIIEATKNAVVCVNLMDEAKKKNIEIDIDELSLHLGVPVVASSAISSEGLGELMNEVYNVSHGLEKTYGSKIEYDDDIEQAISILAPCAEKLAESGVNPRWLSLRLIDMDESFKRSAQAYLGKVFFENEMLNEKLSYAKSVIKKADSNSESVRDRIVSAVVQKAEYIYKQCVKADYDAYNSSDRKIDRILTSKSTGIPVMLLLLGFVFWLTIAGANYPSKLLSCFLFGIQDKLTELFNYFNAPDWLHGVAVLGVYRTLAWVVSVMLPPMAIFFPLFTLLEDFGYLPRIAFNMDKYFKLCSAHGKQSLTMCMGFGCNACGVIGCRIIDSPRERLIAVLTNSFVPCNGRFPTLIAIIAMFFAGAFSGFKQSVFSAAILTAVIIFSVLMTLFASKILSATILKGMPSSFALELPPYRKPQIGRVIVRSVFDRTLFVLGRAVCVAAPAGLIIWLMSNIYIGGSSILSICTGFLNPFAQLIGLDGVILTAFILGFPANEIVIPIIIMSYMSTGSMVEYESLEQLKQLLASNGWTSTTAICTMLFSLMHFPCATTLWTIKKETASLRATVLAFFIPLACGAAICFIVASAARLTALF
ncbi:MAG TPA: ferrous iron transport protein B [Ruminococcaceae bacterium]|nr:ferrous iron transport protein B [Oscillospiraceae bacterium]